MACAEETESSVVPSGAARATMPAASVPPAPGRLSTITCCFQVSPNFCAI